MPCRDGRRSDTHADPGALDVHHGVPGGLGGGVGEADKRPGRSPPKRIKVIDPREEARHARTGVDRCVQTQLSVVRAGSVGWGLSKFFSIVPGATPRASAASLAWLITPSCRVLLACPMHALVCDTVQAPRAWSCSNCRPAIPAAALPTPASLNTLSKGRAATAYRAELSPPCEPLTAMQPASVERSSVIESTTRSGALMRAELGSGEGKGEVFTWNALRVE